MTRVVNRNDGEDALRTERLSLPGPYLAVFAADDGLLWTTPVTLVRERSGAMGTVKIHEHPPEEGDGAGLLSPPREKPGQGSLVRALSALFGGSGGSLERVPDRRRLATAGALAIHGRQGPPDTEVNVEGWLSSLLRYVELDRLLELLRATLLAVAGWVAAKLVAAGVVRAIGRHFGGHYQALLWRVSYWGEDGLSLMAALHQVGFDLGVLLGAAGILSVAVGSASQTSASNLISGLFLLAERLFSVGDVIEMGDTPGEVIVIDLLSVKIRTFDNLFVRIPNESLIKSEVTTLTKFPLRGIDPKIGVAY